MWALWGLDVYMVKTAPHWGQHEVIEAYYRDRKNPDELLVAYQMNWKGENFYTGNHAAMLECGLPLCRERTPEWLRRHAGQRVFFVTEHSRASSVIGQVRQVNGTARTITDEYDNNKFVLVEAQL